MTRIGMDIEVCYAMPDSATRIAVRLENDATVMDAIRESGIVVALALDLSTLSFAVFGRRAIAGTPLRDGDRVELLRPLVVDPKQARHRRAEKKRVGGGA